MAENKINFDDDQKNAVETENTSVVSAGAGSGKTRVLSSRFAHLVLNKKYKVEEILTLTFTKKATTEMYGRIYKTLHDADPSTVNEFHKANIKTLDSYCDSIARQGAHFWGISPSFTIDKDSINELVASKALPFILSHKDNKAIQAIVKTKNFDEIASGLFVEPILNNSTITQPLDFDHTLERQRKIVADVWDNLCNACLDEYDTVAKSFEDYEGNKSGKFMTNLSDALGKEIPENPRLDENYFEKADTSAMEEFADFLNSLAYLNRTGTRNLGELKESLDRLRELTDNLYPLISFVSSGPLTKEILPLMKEFQQMANDIKRQNSILTFSDVSSIALKTLIEHPEIRLAEKKKFKAIMIDEFQDNNSMQRDLLFLLAEKIDRMEKSIPSPEEIIEGKLFFVGDEKQSIYRFRGADVSVFRALSQDFEKGNLSLKTNYRSNSALIASFNTIFGGIPYPTSPDFENPESASKTKIPSVFFKGSTKKELVPDYEAIYNAVEIPLAKKEEIQKTKKDATEFKNIYEPRVHIALYNKQAEADSDRLINEQAETLWVAKKIKWLIDEKNVDPKDIAVLFRVYKSQPRFEKLFLQMGIPYSTETITGFFNSAVVSDIFSFLRIIAYPDDMVAFEKVLRSSIVNLSVNESNAILAQSNSAFDIDGKNVLQGKSTSRYELAKALYEKLFISSKENPISQTVTELWYNAGYRYETMWNQKSTMYASLYDRIFELARQADASSESLGDFVDSVRTYEDETKQLENMDIPLEQNSGVHILSIHKSKGLEYKYVFICDCNHGSMNERNDKPVYVSKNKNGTSDITINFGSENYFFNKVKMEHKRMAAAELRRLTYVAITRAIEEVYLTGVSDIKIEEGASYAADGEKLPASILQTLLPSISYFVKEEELTTVAHSPFTFEIIEPMINTASEDLDETKQSVISRLEKNYNESSVISKDFDEKKYISPSKLEPYDAESSGEKKNVPFTEIDALIDSTVIKSGTDPRFSHADFGIIAHGYMEAAINKCEPVISNKSIVGLDGNEKKLQTIKQICKKMQDSFIKSEIGKAASNSKWHKAEYSFRSYVAGKIISGQIDLVFENDDGTYTIVDYKTNQEKVPEIYFNQLACYRQAVSQMQNVEPEKIRCVLYYLRYGQEIDITEKCSEVDLEKAVKEVTTV